ncbi:Arylsulfatase [Pontiella desulfatans]|uniref:Arylsulfatase n=1 Tax=Pontiella desulfatans TaxID=2750659 RepID=A0A6C2U881_PONDE|nr:arylsulfatase [Pontiella desulfatans]SPS74030.1 sulfatase S1_15 [Kiritimatiellales bacterium]VGO16308.1 Arylsulfatase [Pontiella desulfatans]
MIRRTITLILLVGAAYGAKPNIVYILADDMGYGDVGALNPECKFPTPNLDRMAGEGMIFTDAHTSSSCCTPTRYGILTGRYAWRTPLKSGVLSGYSELMIDTERTTVASFLKEQGYQTACIGKWHMGVDWPTTDGKPVKSRATGPNVDYSKEITGGPLDVGFDYWYGLAGSLGMPPHGFIENRRLTGELGEFAKGKGKDRESPLFQCRPGQSVKGFSVHEVLRRITERAVGYVAEAAKKQEPFFLYFSLNSPHSPVAPGTEWMGKSGISPYADFMMETDWSVGEIYAALEKAGIAENTLVIFTADNGCSQTAGFDTLAEAGHRPGGIYRGLKGTLYEGGHRVAHLAKWPATIQAGSVSDDTICTTDLLATVAEMHGKTLADTEGEDSVSFYSAFRGKPVDASLREGVVHHSSDGHFAIRRGKWKLVLHPGNGMKKTKDTGDMPPVKNPADIQLFDLDADPTETVNIQADHPETVQSMKVVLAKNINDGRSTPGAPQLNAPAKKGWKQIGWMKEL